jgi:hypothetical protein
LPSLVIESRPSKERFNDVVLYDGVRELDHAMNT